MAIWRPMTERDLPGVMRVADEIHRALPEREVVFRERLRLFPEGCMVLVTEEGQEEGQEKEEDEEKDKGQEGTAPDGSGGGGGGVGGYVVSFPIRRGRPPGLDQLLEGGAIAADADQYYVHDVAVLPALRGRGAAARAVTRLLDTVARRFPTTCLISVYGTAPFWARFGFAPEPLGDDADADALRHKLRGYGPDATYLVRRNV
ncbi:hypothetical protein VTH06DRAFT_7478 [Thermothelomyces fergusii]